jgi:MFS family permease
MSRTAALRPLQDRRFRWYFASRSVDLVGDFMGSIALAFAVLQVAGSAGDLGLVLAARSVPMVVLILFGGVLADRWGQTLVIQLSNVVAAAANLAIAGLVLTGTAEVWHLMLLAAVAGAAGAANIPALSSLLPVLAPAGALQSANALNALLRNVATVVAPALGGVLVAWLGAGWVVALNGVTYLVASALLLPVRLPRPERHADEPGVLADLRDGWTYVRSTTWLWVVAAAFGVLNALQAGGYNTLGPVLADTTDLGEVGWGLVLMAGGAGLVSAALVMLVVPLHGRLLARGMAACALFGLPMIALATTSQLWLLMAAAFVGGVAVEMFSMAWNLAMQEHVPPSMLSRAYAYDSLVSFVAIPVGQLTFGPLGEAFGVRRMLLVAGVGYAVVCLLPLLSRSVRDLRRLPAG